MPIFDPGVPLELTPVITRAALFERLSDAEWEDIELALAHDPSDTLPNRKKAARLRARLRRLEAYRTLDLSQLWVAQFFKRLETDNVLAAGRADQITSKVIDDTERRRGL